MTETKDLAIPRAGHDEAFARIQAWLEEHGIKAKFELRTDRELRHEPYVRYKVTFESPEQAELAYKMPTTRLH